jgi:drug/metabolite transporter (DMT)-like permease
MYYAFALLASVLLAAEFGFSKKYQLSEGSSPAAVLRFNVISGLASAGIMWAFSGFRLEWSGFSFLLASAMGLCCVGYTLLGFHVLKLGGMALYSTFLMSGGMVLPYLFGISFLGEPLTLPRTLGILAMLAAVILSNSRKERFSGKLLALCAGVFFLNGIVSILSKCHQITGRYEAVSSAHFVMYSGLCKCFFCSALLWCKYRPLWNMRKASSFPVAVGAALISAISYLVQLICAKHLPASVLYPMITGGSVVFSALAGLLCFRERLSKDQFFGIVLCMIGALLFI